MCTAGTICSGILAYAGLNMSDPNRSSRWRVQGLGFNRSSSRYMPSQTPSENAANMLYDSI